MAAPILTAQQIEAAELIAEGRVTDSEIAAKFGVTRQTIWVWRQKPEFEAKVVELIEVANAAARRRAVSHVERRLDRLNRDWLRLQKVIEERAEDPDMAVAAGGTTGLLARKQKSLGSGPMAVIVDEFEVDVAVLKELREIEKQAAIELGQWTQKIGVTADVSDKGRRVVIPGYVKPEE